MQKLPIVITGAGGFVGRVLVDRLLDRGESIVAIDNHLDCCAPGARVIVGDIGDRQVIADAFSGGCSAVIHLATVPGGAAEVDPDASRRININAMYDMLEVARTAGPRPRLVYASSIAALGDPLPEEGVNDATPLAPKMIYGGHKAMMEVAVALMHNRGEIDGVSLRLPGIVARPKGPSGMKSAFMSEVFHALAVGEHFDCPVSADATIWAQSVSQCAANCLHALDFDGLQMPKSRAVTLPALRITMTELVAEIARQCYVSPDLVSYVPNAAIEAGFGRQPPLATAAAEWAGFAHDGTLPTIVASALKTLR